jgi:hypothetical protein
MVEGWPLDQVIARHLKYATALVDAGVTFRNPQTAEIEAHRTCPVKFDDPLTPAPGCRGKRERRRSRTGLTIARHCSAEQPRQALSHCLDEHMVLSDPRGQ